MFEIHVRQDMVFQGVLLKPVFPWLIFIAHVAAPLGAFLEGHLDGRLDVDPLTTHATLFCNANMPT
jgi:hypothetical protein